MLKSLGKALGNLVTKVCLVDPQWNQIPLHIDACTATGSFQHWECKRCRLGFESRNTALRCLPQPRLGNIQMVFRLPILFFSNLTWYVHIPLGKWDWGAKFSLDGCESSDETTGTSVVPFVPVAAVWTLDVCSWWFQDIFMICTVRSI